MIKKILKIMMIRLLKKIYISIKISEEIDNEYIYENF